MTQKAINWKPEPRVCCKRVEATSHLMPELLDAVKSASRIDDARVLTDIALSQVKEEYESNSTIHKLVIMLEAIQGILEAETDSLQHALDKCNERLNIS